MVHAGIPGMDSALRIMVLTQRLPMPILGGLDLRTLAIIKALSRMAAVSVCGIWGDVRAQSPGDAAWCSLSDRTPPSSGELFAHYLASPSRPYAGLMDTAAARRLSALVREFQPTHILASRLQVWPYIEFLQDTWSGPVILDLDEVAEPLTASLEVGSSRREGIIARVQRRINRAIIRYEAAAVESAHAVLVSSPVEFAHVQRIHGRSTRCVVIPNGIDLDDYPRQSGGRDARTALFPGNFAYPPNEQAAREIVTAIAPRLPSHTFRIAGSHLPEWLNAAQSDRIIPVGQVGRMQDEFTRASLALLPVRAGGGTRLKALEALATGTPIVATPKAIEGLALEGDTHLLVAETTSQLIDAIRQVDDDPSRARERAESGYRFVADHHSVGAIATAFSDGVSTWM